MKIPGTFAAFVFCLSAIKPIDATICTMIDPNQGSTSPQPGGIGVPSFVVTRLEAGTNRPIEFKLDAQHHTANQPFPYDSKVAFWAKIQYYPQSRLYSVGVVDLGNSTLKKGTRFYVEFLAHNYGVMFEVKSFEDCSYFTLPNDVAIEKVNLYLV